MAVVFWGLIATCLAACRESSESHMFTPGADWRLDTLRANKVDATINAVRLYWARASCVFTGERSAVGT